MLNPRTYSTSVRPIHRLPPEHQASARRGRHRSGRTGLPTFALALLLVASGCGDSPSSPDGGDLRMEPAAPLLESVHDSIVVQVTQRDGTPVTGLRLVRTGDSRELPELPVLSSEALGRGVLSPIGPGAATVRATSDQGTLTFVVRVDPAGPTIFAAGIQPGSAGADTVRLLGSHLDELPSEVVARVGAMSVPTIRVGPSELRFEVPLSDAHGCSGPSPMADVLVQGAEIRSGLQIHLARPGELRLARGEWQRLPLHSSGCLRLPPVDGEYVLAYADLREIEASRTRWMTAGDPYTLRISDRSGSVAGPASTGTRTGAQLSEDAWVHPVHVPFAGATASGSIEVASSTCSDDDFSNPFNLPCRSRPWEVGDRMTIRRPHAAPDTVTATVYRVDGGRFVFAQIDGDDSPELAELRARIDEAMPHVMELSVPFLEEVFGSNPPVTSAGSGQLLTLIGDFNHGSVAGGCCYPGLGPWSAVLLGSTLRAPKSTILYLLTHEFTHAWQARWYYDTRPESAATNSGNIWGLEGGADLLAYEVIRRYSGVPWGANREIGSFRDGADADYPLVREMEARGDLASGYTETSSFLRDVVARMVRRGSSVDDAFTAVARGSLEGWFGIDWVGAVRPGLAGRVREHLDPGWDPATAVLLYTLSQGADDLTSTPDLQNPFYHAIGREPLGDGFGALALEAGAGSEDLTIERLGSSTGLVRLIDRGSGSSFALESDRQETGWAIVRIR